MARKRVTGLGGVFFRADDPKKLAAWYRAHLDLPASPEGVAIFEWKSLDKSGTKGQTVWGVFPADTKYFGSRRQECMLNYRVTDLTKLLETLRKERVKVLGREDSKFGKFAWIEDPEGNRIELWEPPTD